MSKCKLEMARTSITSNQSNSNVSVEITVMNYAEKTADKRLDFVFAVSPHAILMTGKKP